MSRTQAKKAVLLAMVIAGAATTARRLTVAGELPTPRVLVGVILAGLALALLAEVAPSAAGAFAVLIIISTILTAGDVWQAIADLTSRP